MRPQVEVGETRSSGEKVDTALARNARGDPVESMEGDDTSAMKELGAIKTPDEQRETAPAQDAREDFTKQVVSTKLPSGTGMSPGMGSSTFP